MSQNTVKARIQLKSDTESNWNKALHFIPLRGEIIIYLTDESHPFSRLKVGDGTTPVIDLPFVTNGNSTIAEYHTTEEWNQQRDYIPKAGALIIYSDKSIITKDGVEYYQPSFKVGDGVSYLIDLPFFDDYIVNHINDAEHHITAQEREFWNNKINCKVNVLEETLIIDRN